MKTLFKKVSSITCIALFSIAAQAEGELANSPKRGWDGWYIGLDASVANQTDAAECVSGTWNCKDIPINNPMQKAMGSTQGLHVGYNWEIEPTYIFGLELGVQKPSLNGSAVFPTDGQYKSAETTYESLQTAQMRLGREFDNNLLYVTGGVAWARLQTRFINRYNNGNIINDPNGYLENTTTTRGYIFGFGIEHAFTDNLSIGCELSQTYLQAIQFDVSTQINAGEAQNWIFEKVNPNLTLLKFAVNYRF